VKVVACVLVLVLLAGTGLAGTCLGACADDGLDGTCAPTCTDCVCCSHVQAGILLLDAQGVHERTSVIAEPAPDQGLLAGSADEILHVPRLSR
jgi:hypothetical protein